MNTVYQNYFKTIMSMRCSLSFFFFFLFLFCLKAQHIPDTEFAAGIKLNCSTCITINADMTGELVTEPMVNPNASTLTNLDFAVLTFADLANITDLTGIGSFTSLTYLSFSGATGITTVPTLPNSLITVIFSQGSLANLPATLPASLKSLTVDNNVLMGLPPLPATLIGLDCHINQIISLPALPNNLSTLTCIGNKLTSIPALHDSLIILRVSNNANLSCLPTLPSGLSTLEIDGTKITCLPNKPANINNMVPICTGPCTPFSCPTTTHNNKIQLTCRLDSVGFIISVNNTYDVDGTCLLASDTTKLALKPCCAGNIITLTKSLFTCNTALDGTTRKDTVYNKISGCIDSVIVSNFTFKSCCPTPIYSTKSVNICDPKLDKTTRTDITQDANKCLLTSVLVTYNYVQALCCPNPIFSNTTTNTCDKTLDGTTNTSNTYDSNDCLLTSTSTTYKYNCGTDYQNYCPQIHKNFGQACDDGNSKTVNDRVRNDCNCRGDYVSNAINVKCPQNMTVVSTSIYGTVVVWDEYNIFSPSASVGGCSPIVNVKLTSGYYSQYPFPPNSLTYEEYIATDNCGNKASCEFFVTTTPVQNSNSNLSVSASKKSIMNISPNPVSEILSVSLNVESETNSEIQVANTFGQIILKERLTLSKGDNNFEINVTSLASGVYFLRIDNSLKKPIKFVKE